MKRPVSPYYTKAISPYYHPNRGSTNTYLNKMNVLNEFPLAGLRLVSRNMNVKNVLVDLNDFRQGDCNECSSREIPKFFSFGGKWLVELGEQVRGLHSERAF